MKEKGKEWKPSFWVFFSAASADGKIAERRIVHNEALAAAGLPHVALHGLYRSSVPSASGLKSRAACRPKSWVTSRAPWLRSTTAAVRWIYCVNGMTASKHGCWNKPALNLFR